MNTTIEEIEILAKVYAGARTELAERVTALRDEQEAIKRRRLQGIKNSLERVTDAHEKLKEAVTNGRDLFDRPKTRILHGIKVGWMKQKGEIEIADEGASITMLRKVLGKEESAAYIKVTEKPIRSALQTLSAAILKRCGITLKNDTDAVLIKATDSDVDKLVNALLGDAEDAEIDA